VIVVDANVIAYLFLPCEATARAEALYQRDPDWAAPVLWRSEFRNVLATQVRRRSLTLELATALQAEAEDLMAGREYQVPSADVLRIAAESGCSAYDCEYVLLARQINVPLVTSDQAVLAAFPGTAVPLAD
jgi:predicted nucleic acid-binding protein